MCQVRHAAPGCDPQAFAQTRRWAEARRAQGSREQFIPLTTFTLCRLQRIVFYFSQLVLCPWRDLSSVLNIDQRRKMRLVPSSVTLSPWRGWRWQENRPGLQYVFLLWLCSCWWPSGFSPSSAGELREGNANWGCFAPRCFAPRGRGGSDGGFAQGAGYLPATGPAGARGQEVVAYGRRIIPAGSGAGVPQPRGATVMAERCSTEFCTDARGSGGCRSDTGSASPAGHVLPDGLRAGCSQSLPLLRDLQAHPELLCVSPPLCLATRPGWIHLWPVLLWWDPVQDPWGARPPHGAQPLLGAWARCLGPVGKAIARPTAFLIKSLLYNLRGASAV